MSGIAEFELENRKEVVGGISYALGLSKVSKSKIYTLDYALSFPNAKVDVGTDIVQALFEKNFLAIFDILG